MLKTVAKPAPMPPARILIAADQPLEALALEAMLRTSFEVRVTSDAREIMPLLDKWPYAGLVLDLDIRPYSSFTVLEQLTAPIRQHELAVLAILEAPDPAREERALDAGAAAVLARPLNRDDTVKSMTDALASIAKAHPAVSVDEAVLRAVQKRFAPL